MSQSGLYELQLCRPPGPTSPHNTFVTLPSADLDTGPWGADNSIVSQTNNPNLSGARSRTWHPYSPSWRVHVVFQPTEMSLSCSYSEKSGLISLLADLTSYHEGLVVASFVVRGTEVSNRACSQSSACSRAYFLRETDRALFF
ncbi:uncharacterized [Tachysurus ichikawai]